MTSRASRSRKNLIAVVGIGCAVVALVGSIQFALAMLNCDLAEKPVGTCQKVTVHAPLHAA